MLLGQCVHAKGMITIVTFSGDKVRHALLSTVHQYAIFYLLLFKKNHLHVLYNAVYQ